MNEIDRYNPYPTFQEGQKEAITQILDLYEEGQKVIELNAPTASGKSLDLYVLGLILSNEHEDKVIYTTPQVALVDQLGENSKFSDMPVLKGKRNYPCGLLPDTMADECPFSKWDKAIAYCGKGGLPCSECAYQLDREIFNEAKFGATTFARYILDPACHQKCKALLIDESSGLEKALVDSSTLKLPENTDVRNLRESVMEYAVRLQISIDDLGKEIASYENPLKYELEEIVKLKKRMNRLTRELHKCMKVISHIDKKHNYIVDRELQFRLLEGKTEFERLVQNLDLVILASGTPTSAIYAEDYKIVQIQHPIPLKQRLIHYYPVGLMNYAERNITAPKISNAIETLHNKYHKKTMVHCGSYVVAKMLYNHLSLEMQKITILQEDPKQRKLYKDMFAQKEGECVFLSIAFSEGIDLKGPDYPMNIIAKIPFENIKDEFIAHRNQHDNYLRYNTFVAVDVMQSAGRCTRTPSDFSETWILDKSWQSLFNRNKKLFAPWFVAALTTEAVLGGRKL